MVPPIKAHAILDRILELDRVSGADVASSLIGLQERRTVIGERSHISLIGSIPHVRHGAVVRSKAEAVRALQRMNAAPLSMVQIWENDEVVFWAEFTSRSVRVLRHLEGDWEAALKQGQSVAANRAAA